MARHGPTTPQRIDMVALSVTPQRIWWDSLPAVVRARMEGSRVGLNGMTDLQALVLEVRCRLGWSRSELGLAMGLTFGGWPRRRPTVTQAVWRWEAGLSVPRKQAWGRLAELAREHEMPMRLIRELERMEKMNRTRVKRTT